MAIRDSTRLRRLREQKRRDLRSLQSAKEAVPVHRVIVKQAEESAAMLSTYREGLIKAEALAKGLQLKFNRKYGTDSKIEKETRILRLRAQVARLERQLRKEK